MNTRENLIVISDKEGRSLICKLDHECSGSDCRLDTYEKISKEFKDLSKHERGSCKVLVGNIW